MREKEELDLVLQALRSAEQVHWDPRSAGNVRNNHDLDGLPVEEITSLLIDFRLHNGKISQKKETREPWINRYKYYYKAIVPVAGFKHGLFIEMRLVDDDADFPIVSIVNAHPQQK